MEATLASYKFLKKWGAYEKDAIEDLDEQFAKSLVAEGIVEQVEVDGDPEGDAESIAKEVGRQLGATIKEHINAELKAIKEAIGEFGIEDITGVHDRLEDDPKGGYKDASELFRAVKSGSMPGAELDDRQKLMRHQGEKDASGNSEESGSSGEFLAPPEYSNNWLQREGGDLDILSQCDQYTLKSNSLEAIGLIDHDKSGTTYRHGGVVVYWVGEAGQITASQLKFRKVTLKVNKLAAMCYVTDEMLEDCANCGQKINEKAGEAIHDELNESFMFGNGVGKPQGGVSSSACVEIAKETSQTADTIVANNVIKMYQSMYSKGKGKANFYYNDECLVQLLGLNAGGTTTTSGAYPHMLLFMPPGGLTQAPHSMIFGRPAIATDHCEALGDAGDIAFCDWSQYMVATKGTTKTAMSIHLRFDYGETAFRFTFRVDGRPAWDRALTPRKGSITVSPFVKVAARA